jgi:D-sedoheptulose 7-phosphate isomerase
MIKEYLKETAEIAENINTDVIEKMVSILVKVRSEGGRLFFIGVGGGAGHASHAVCDFRKICGFEAYCPSDNASELTARANDEGWETTYSEWLKGSRIEEKDAVFVFSVGGGDEAKNISVNLVRAMQTAKSVGASILGVIGREAGFANQVGDAVLVVPNPNPKHITAHTEEFQAIVWHLLVSHPDIAQASMKWEGTNSK